MEEIQRTEYIGTLVLTTQQIASAYETNTDTITKNFNRNKDRYVEGKHYICLKGEKLRDFKTNGQIDLSLKLNKLYLWTKKGAFLHAKSLNTDTAWEVYDRLVDSYFYRQENRQQTSLADKMQIRIYKNNKWYILTMGDNVYSLKPEEAVTINRCVSAMLKNGATQIEGVINSLLDGFGRDCRLECINQCSIPLKIGIEEKEGGAE